MNILLVAATRTEIEPLLAQFNIDETQPIFKAGENTFTLLITGVGMVATAFTLGQHLANNYYNLAINLGIAGSFDFNLALGEVLHITEDVFAEQGAEDGDDFLAIDDLGLGESSQIASVALPLENLSTLQQLKQVKAITVNKVHGNELSIAKAIARFKPQIESMEGAAFFYACSKMQTSAIQIRAISNYVERRNKEKWNIGLAVKNLNKFATELIGAIK